MDKSDQNFVQLAPRAEALRVLAAKVEDEESRDTILQWAADYERLQSALLNWCRSPCDVSEKQEGLPVENVERHSETAEYRSLIAEFQRLIGEMQEWQGAFEEECDFLKELERMTRWRFAQSRPFLRVL